MLRFSSLFLLSLKQSVIAEDILFLLPRLIYIQREQVVLFSVVVVVEHRCREILSHFHLSFIQLPLAVEERLAQLLHYIVIVIWCEWRAMRSNKMFLTI